MPDQDRPAPVVPALRDRLAVGGRVCKRLGYGLHQQAAALIALALLGAAKAGVDVLAKSVEDELIEAGREAEKAIKATLGQPVDPAAVAVLALEVAGLRMAAQHESAMREERAAFERRAEEEALAAREAVAAQERARLEAAAAEEAKREAAAQLARQEAEAAAQSAQAQQRDPLDELGEQGEAAASPSPPAVAAPAQGEPPAAKPPPRKR